MNAIIDNETIAESVDMYGKTLQSIVCMEELSELSQAISKMLRGKDNRENLCEEIADVLICIEMLMDMYAIQEYKIQAWIEIKQSIQRDRMRGK